MRPWLIGFAVVAAVAAVIAVAWRMLPQRREYFTDAESIKVPIATARVREVLWERPTPLPDLINAGAEDYEPRVSADGMTLYFVRGKAGLNADVFVASRTPLGWGDPQPMTKINSEADELGPQPSADGQAIYFYSNRVGGLGGYDLWVSRLGPDGQWRTPENLGSTVNSEFNDYGPALTPGGNAMYFSSNRPQPGDAKAPDPNAWPATLREDLFHRTYDLYLAAITDRGVGKAEPIDPLNTPYNEGAPAVSSFGDFLYFASDRPGGAGGFDLYRSRRMRGGHEPATSLGDTVNSLFHELDPALSMGGFGLDFSSDRPVHGWPADAPREYNLYHTNSREVFAEAERIDRPPIHWAGLWAAIGPNLLWALLALILLLLMLALVKSVRNRKLSLLARCLLASLAAHLLLMMLFNTWQVAEGIAGEFHRKGPIQVALGATGRGNTIAAQIRGNLTAEFDAPPPAGVVAKRQTIRLTAVAPSARTDVPVEHRKMEFVPTMTLEARLADADARTSVPNMPLPRVEASEPRRLGDFPFPADAKRVDAAEPDIVGQAQTVEPKSALRWMNDLAVARRMTANQSPLPHRSTDVATTLASRSFVASAAPHEASPAHELTIGYKPSLLRADAMPIAEPRLPDAPNPSPAGESAVFPAPQTGVPLPARAELEAGPPTVHSVASADFRPEHIADWAVGVPLAMGVSASLSDAPLPAPAPATGRALVHSKSELPPPIGVLGAGLALPAAQDARTAATDEALPKFEPVSTAMSRISPERRLKPSSVVGDRPIDLPPKAGAAALRELGGSLMDTLRLAHDAAEQKYAPKAVAAAHTLDTAAVSIPSNFGLNLNLDFDPDPVPAVEQMIGMVRGTVTEAATGRAIADAKVQLALPDRPPLTAVTDAEGRYTLAVPSVPEFFALSASHEGFVPLSTGLERADIEKRRSSAVDFSLERTSPQVAATEAVPDVHHLGDDRFNGAINSQFQKQSEGTSFTAPFEVDQQWLKTPIERAEVRLLVKGVQRRHRVYINGQQLERRLDESPEDGGFGEFVALFDPSILVAGSNQLRIVAAPSSDDIDDFEFVNIRVYLVPSRPADVTVQ